MFQTSKYLGVDNILPSGRGGSTSVLHNGKIVMFGGHYLLSEGKYEYLNDVWVFDTKNPQGVWLPIKLKGDKNDQPPPRYGHSAHIVEDKMIIFGGKGFENSNLNDLWYLDLNKFSWSIITPVSKNKPLGRLFHASVLLNSNKLLIHGGWNGDDVYADGWFFDLYLLSWERIPFSKTSKNNTTSEPEARFGHTMTQISNDNILLFGGCILPSEEPYTPVYSNQMKILNTETMTWNRCRTLGRSPTGRYGHSASLMGSVDRPLLTIIGGWGCKGVQTIETVNDPMAYSICVFDIKNETWFTVNANTNETNIYKSSFNHAAVIIPTTTINDEQSDDNFLFNKIGNKVFLYGGFDQKATLKHLLKLDFQFDA